MVGGHPAEFCTKSEMDTVRNMMKFVVLMKPAQELLYIIVCVPAPFQRTAIREAMTQIQTDVSNCVRFTEFDNQADEGEDFINIVPSDSTLLKFVH